jgi:tripartite motif-containing protein 71
VFTRDGKFVRKWGHQGSGDKEFLAPTGLCLSTSVSPLGPSKEKPLEVFVCDLLQHRVKIFDEKGAFKRSWGNDGLRPGLLYKPYAIGVTRDGNIMVASEDRYFAAFLIVVVFSAAFMCDCE